MRAPSLSTSRRRAIAGREIAGHRIAGIAVIALATGLVSSVSCGGSTPSIEGNNVPAPDAAAFVAEQVAALRPLQVEASQRWFAASVSGTDEDFARSKEADVAVDAFRSDQQRFAAVKAWRERAISDPLVHRQVELLYLEMLGKQVDPALLAQITGLEKKIEQAFNTYRGAVDGAEMTYNEIHAILATSTDSAALRAAWEGQKGVGAQVAADLLALVELRNQVAKELGFRDFFALRLAESELDEAALLSLFDELDRLTRAPFLAAKAVVDARLAERLGVATGELMPWHYQNPFFQEPPDVFLTGLDAIYKKSDTLALCRSFYEGIGLPVAAIIERSDLYEKPGKTPHAFAVDVDREGDVRMLANIVPGLQWQGTMIHELGHAVYDDNIDRALPWLLRQPTHALTTEGLAMMVDDLVADPRWAEALGVMTAEQRQASMAEARAYRAFAELQFSRWTQVMLHFERAMYADPRQDLNTLWWQLVQEYQGLRQPTGRSAPDYASKVHLIVAPAYYQNYMLGKLFAAQVHEAVAAHLGQPPTDAIYVGDPRVGAFLTAQVFGPGARYSWNALTERATGRALGPEAFARRFRGATP